MSDKGRVFQDTVLLQGVCKSESMSTIWIQNSYMSRNLFIGGIPLKSVNTNVNNIRISRQQKLWPFELQFRDIREAMNELIQLNLNPSPTDIPSTLVFHPQNPTSLLVSSWDSTLRYYTISTNPSAQLISQYNQPAPILDVRFSHDGRNAATGSVNGSVNWYSDLRGETNLGST